LAEQRTVGCLQCSYEKYGYLKALQRPAVEVTTCKHLEEVSRQIREKLERGEEPTRREKRQQKVIDAADEAPLFQR
jgi:predicted  nucleic acid-binding Zn-ribbon protein